MIKVLVIGAGGIAQAHINSFNKINDAKIVGVADVKLERAQKLAYSCGAKAYKNFQEGLSEVDLVYILTPPSVRKDIALKVIEAGKDIVMEKPIAIDLQDAEAMINAAKKADIKFMVGFNHRFRNGFIRLKEEVKSGNLGEIVSIWSERLGMGVPSKKYNWRTDPNLLCGMTVESLSHDIDFIRWIAGEIVSVRAKIFGTRDYLPEFDDNASVIFTLESGATATIFASWSSHVGKNSRGVIGKAGTALVEGGNLWDFMDFRWRTDSMKYEMSEHINDRLDVTSYENENKYFVHCVKYDLAPEPNGHDGLQALRISHSILASAKEGRAINLPQDLGLLTGFNK